jgi:formylglycine-generating enzyme
MRRAIRAIATALAFFASPVLAQTAPTRPTITNAIGMELVLIEPGTMRVGRFAPGCPHPPVAGGAVPNAVAGVAGTGAAGTGGVAVRGPSAFADPRSQWDSSDFARCEALVRAERTDGFISTIARPYYIGRYEVTQAEWTRVMGSNPSVFRGSRVKDDAARHPVDNVTWDDARAFVRKLNALDPGARYRLPTELEWEYAARAGAEGDLAWTDIREQAWEQDVDKGTTHAVGGKKPNAWGLYDTLGNVWEWVEDFYNERWFPTATPPKRGTVHVLRGGSFLTDVKNTTYFTHAGGPANGFDVGFRVVREVR